MKNFNRFASILFVIIVFSRCSNNTLINTSISEAVDLNDTTFVFIGMEWCAGTENNFINIFVPRVETYSPNTSIAIFYCSEDYYYNLLSKTGYKGKSFCIRSKGGLVDKISANNFLKHNLSDYKYQDFVPLMVIVYSKDSYEFLSYNQ